MSQIVNIYCDESGHLKNDHQTVMVLGSVWCPADKVQEINSSLRDLKTQFSLSESFETKWTKVSPAKEAYYRNVIDYFFDDDDLHFRALVITQKDRLDHERFHQDHDTWYYKMYFTMLRALINPDNKYRIYIDIKDTRSEAKVRKLHEVLCHANYDFNGELIERVQQVRSHEVEVLQVADLLIGAVGAANRANPTSDTKKRLIARMKKRTGLSLARSTWPSASKFNLFFWSPSGAADG